MSPGRGAGLIALQPAATGRWSPRRRARVLRDLSWVLILSGLILLADAATTLLWQEPVTALVAVIERSQINLSLLDRPPRLSVPDRQALAELDSLPRRIAFLARREQRALVDGQAIGRLRIPRIGGKFVVIQGTDQGSLEKGPGHYPETPLPGLGETVAIAGHRTTYLAPFRHIDSLRPGDLIVLSMPYARFTYVVQYRRIVEPSAWWVTRDLGYDRLVLSACNPLYSAAQRLVVFARLASLVPRGLARMSASAAPPRAGRSSGAGALRTGAGRSSAPGSIGPAQLLK